MIVYVFYLRCCVCVCIVHLLGAGGLWFTYGVFCLCMHYPYVCRAVLACGLLTVCCVCVCITLTCAGLCWVLEMYRSGCCPDYRYVYPFRCAPDAATLLHEASQAISALRVTDGCLSVITPR